VPRLPKLRISALDDLAKQLRFAPAETLRRQLERAEGLAAEIDPTRNYPEDWLVFRVTGYRPQIDSPAVFVGEALLGDLSAFIERLSAAAKVTEADLSGGAFLTVAALRERWAVSAKTLERYRRMGLIARRVSGPSGRAWLAFPREAVERFERGHRAKLEDARSYTRIDPALRLRLIRRASAYRRKLGWSRDRVSRRLAARFKRGHETVRQLLIGHDKQSTSPIFAETGPPAPRERRLIDGAHWRGIEPGEVAERLGRSKAAVQRVINEERAERLRSVLGGARGMPEIEQPSALAARKPRPKKPRPPDDAGPALDSALLGQPGVTDLLALIQAARQITPILPQTERAWAERYHTLFASARGAGASLGPAPRATVLDRIETDLRFAVRLKAVLVRSQLPLVVRTLEAALERPLEEVRGSLLLPLMEESIAALGASVDDFEPAKGGRLAGAAGLALTHVATRFVRGHAPDLGLGGSKARASSRLAPGVAIADWTLHLAPWQSGAGRPWLEPDARIRVALPSLPERMAESLSRRYGWGYAPHTLAELARALGTTPMAAARLERAALRRAIASSRGAKP
jgi:hypothetical protein